MPPPSSDSSFLAPSLVSLAAYRRGVGSMTRIDGAGPSWPSRFDEIEGSAPAVADLPVPHDDRVRRPIPAEGLGGPHHPLIVPFEDRVVRRVGVRKDPDIGDRQQRAESIQPIASRQLHRPCLEIGLRQRQAENQAGPRRQALLGNDDVGAAGAAAVVAAWGVGPGTTVVKAGPHDPLPPNGRCRSADPRCSVRTGVVANRFETEGEPCARSLCEASAPSREWISNGCITS